MKKSTKITWTVIGAVALAALLWLAFRPTAKDSVSLETDTVKKIDISSSVTATGTVEPVTEVEVGTQVSGIIDKLYADYNDVVKAGQVIAEMDKVTLQAELKSATATLGSAKTESDYRTKEYNRIKTLHDKELVSDSEYDEALYQYESAKNALIQAQASYDKAVRNLSYTTITSPIDGVVISRAVEEGQTVAAGFETPTLFTIAQDLTDMQVIADVDEADIGQVSVGQRVSFTVDAYPDDVFNGTVQQVRLEATTSTSVTTYEVVIDAKNPDLKLKPGLTANVTIYTLEEDGVLSVATKALRFTPDEEILKELDVKVGGSAVQASDTTRTLWVLNGNEISPRTVVTGPSSGDRTSITSGLEEGEVVVAGLSAAETAKKTATTERSPFAPGPRGNGNNQKDSTKKIKNMREIIKLDGIKRDFIVGDEIVHALRGVSFTVGEGEFVTIMGKSGSGKSTLLNILGCLDTASQGDYFLDGVSVRDMDKNQRAVLRNRKIGFVFQNYNLLPKTTAIENVELPLMYNNKYTRDQRYARSVEALKAVGLGDRLEHKSNQMSGGQMQRVAIARALVNDPAMILADEATGNLDTRTSFEILVLFQKLHAEGRTIIFVTHNPDLEKYSTRTIILRDGKVISDESNNNVLDAADALSRLPVEND